MNWRTISIEGSELTSDSLASVEIWSETRSKDNDIGHGKRVYEYVVHVHDQNGEWTNDDHSFKVRADNFSSPRAASLYVKEKVFEIFKNREAEISEEEEVAKEEIQRGCYVIALYYTNGELETMRDPLITDRESAQKFCDLYEQQKQVDKARLILSPTKL
jgi:hypothetical protein